MEWKQAEKAVSKRIKGQTERASGAIFNTNDVRSDRFSVEVKTTTRGSFTLSRNLLTQVRDKALRTGKTPLLVITFTDPTPLTVWIAFDESVEFDPDGRLTVL